MRAVLLALTACAALALSLPASPARAQTAEAPPDTAALDRFLQGLADSTDRRYGTVGAPIDTSGLDSSLVAALAGLRPRARGPVSNAVAPWLSFDRAEGTMWGATAYLSRRGAGRLTGQLGYVNGPNEWRGGGEWSRRWGGVGTNPGWSARVGAGRFSESVDTDARRSLVSSMRALGWGRDLLDYMLRDGVRARIERESQSLRVGVGWRNQLESPLVTTTTWNLFDEPLQRVENRPATMRRIQEFEVEATWRVPHMPLWLEGEGRFSADALGSDADYQRVRFAAASDVPVRRWATIVTQVTYGTVFGELMPQNATYLGGWRTLRSITRGEVVSTGRVFGRFEIIESPDLLRWLPGTTGALLNLRVAGVLAAGGAFGDDPFTGQRLAGRSWPALHDWKSEAGIGFLYRPGLPDPRLYYRIDLAHALGPGEPGWRALFSVSTTFNLVRVIE